MSRPRGIAAVATFFFFGAIMACFAVLTLLWPGTILDEAWRLNPVAHAQFASVGNAAGIGFLLLATALTAAAVGWLKRRFWGWVLGVVIICTQVLGDAANLARGDLLRGGTGVVIAGALLAYFLSPGVRAYFRAGRSGSKAG